MQQSNNVLDPVKTVALFNLQNGDYVADFGSGHGYFIVPLARSVAPDGKVFAIDIQRHMLDVSRAKSRLENLYNVEYIWSDVEQPRGSKLKDDFVDLVLITNALHQCNEKEAIIKEAYRVLRSNGRLVLIEWGKDLQPHPLDNTGQDNNTFGPPQSLRISKESLIDLCKNEAFSMQQEFDAGSHHYGMIFSKM